MKRTLIILALFMFMLLSVCYSSELENSKLIKKYGVSCTEYRDNNTSLGYCEKLVNFNRKGDASLVLVLHSGVEKGKLAKQLSFPAVKSLIKYVERKKIKAVILMPQYPLDSGMYPAELINLTEKLTLGRIKQYKIPPNRVLTTGASLGGATIYDIAKRNPNLFYRALFVSYSNGRVKPIYNTNVYFIKGENDNVASVLNAINKLDKHSDKEHKYKILLDSDHLSTIPKAYTNDAWDWLFK